MSAPPPNIVFVTERGFLTREAIAYLSRITASPLEQFIAGQELPIAATSYLTMPFNQSGEVTAATASNSSGTDAQIVVYIVPNGQVPGPQYAVVAYADVPALSTTVLTGLIGQAIPNGASVYAMATVADTLALTISGVRRAL